MRVIEKKIYTIDEHPNPKKCFKWIRDNWHDLNQDSVQEILKSLQALQEKIGGSLHAAISAVPDRGEVISFKNHSTHALRQLKPEETNLTGSTWDADVIRSIQSGNPKAILNMLHDETEAIYSDEGLQEMCEANNYEFYENGKIYKEET